MVLFCCVFCACVCVLGVYANGILNEYLLSIHNNEYRHMRGGFAYWLSHCHTTHHKFNICTIATKMIGSTIRHAACDVIKQTTYHLRGNWHRMTDRKINLLNRYIDQANLSLFYVALFSACLAVVLALAMFWNWNMGWGIANSKKIEMSLLCTAVKDAFVNFAWFYSMHVVVSTFSPISSYFFNFSYFTFFSCHVVELLGVSIK